MTKRMLIDATHPEETRVAILDGSRIEDYDFEYADRKPLKGNIYLAKVMRIEPSLQAAFVEYGGNRHGFLAFSEIHPDYFRIPMADRKYFESAAPQMAGGSGESDREPDAGGPDTDAEADAAEVGFLTAPLPEREETPLDADDSDPVLQEGASDLPPDADEALSEDPDAPQDEELAADGEPRDGEESATPGYETVGGDEVDARPRRRLLRQYKIQEVVRRGQVMLIQVVKEERGNKGAALTTFLSLPGRYAVLMPNSESGGGVSRKITSVQERRRMRLMLDSLDVPEGMSVILRTSGLERSRAEIRRDFDYLLRLWDSIREMTMTSTAPSLIYAEGDLIQRSVRDIFSPEIDEILVDGEDGFTATRNFMQSLMPAYVDRVRLYSDPMMPLFFRHQVETQIDQLHSATVQLRSGGYIVINPTEALVAIDVNSGRATRERNIEETAYRTNLEAAEEIARQLRLRDLAGLIVIDFIDMEDNRNNMNVERRLKDAMRNDRARLQIGRISHFGLLELSRQRLRPSLIETAYEKCPHCEGTGMVRSPAAAAMMVLRALEEEGTKRRASGFTVQAPVKVALYILNQMRDALVTLEKRYGVHVLIEGDAALSGTNFKVERQKGAPGPTSYRTPAVSHEKIMAAAKDLPPLTEEEIAAAEEADRALGEGADGEDAEETQEGRDAGRSWGRDRGRNRRGRNRGRERGQERGQERGRGRYADSETRDGVAPAPFMGDPRDIGTDDAAHDTDTDNFGNQREDTNGSSNPAALGRDGDEGARARRRRGRRGGRRRRGDRDGNDRDASDALPSGAYAAAPGERDGERPGERSGERGAGRPRGRGDGRERYGQERYGHDRNGRPPEGRSAEANGPAAIPFTAPPPAAWDSGYPGTVFEIDTTPREQEARASAARAAAARANAAQIPAGEIPSANITVTSVTAEPRDKRSSQQDVVITEAQDKPKAGWWRRIIGP